MRGQMEHTFTFIMLVILAGVVLLFGYRLIGGPNGILGKSCEVEQLELRQTLDDYLRSFAKYGTVQQKAVQAPCDAQQVCFVDAQLFGEPTAAGIYPGAPSFAYPNMIITSEIRSPTTPPNNIFLVDKDKATVPLQAWSEKIKIADKVLCVNATSGTFQLTFKGEGLRTTIEAT